jgi:hypothetical protein
MYRPHALIGLTLALAAIVATAWDATAQQKAAPDRGLMFDPGRMHSGSDSQTFSSPPQSTPAVRTNPAPDTSTRSQAARQPPRLGRGGEPAATRAARAGTRTPPDDAPRSLGRTPLGTLGFETETKLKSKEFPDGRPIPSFTNNKFQNSTYFGLSLTMPTESQSQSSSDNSIQRHGAD